jgi:hypothetical protein
LAIADDPEVDDETALFLQSQVLAVADTPLGNRDATPRVISVQWLAPVEVFVEAGDKSSSGEVGDGDDKIVIDEVSARPDVRSPRPVPPLALKFTPRARNALLGSIPVFVRRHLAPRDS